MNRPMLTRMCINLHRYATELFTVALITFCEMFYTIEWSSSYCANQSDGPTSAAFGIPFPYWHFGGSSSLEYDFMPQIYILNIVVLWVILFPLIRWIINFLVTNKKYKTILGFIGLSMIFCRAALFIFLLFIGVNNPTLTIGDSSEPYFDFRPVKFISSDGHYDCTSSDY